MLGVDDEGAGLILREVSPGTGVVVAQDESAKEYPTGVDAEDLLNCSAGLNDGCGFGATQRTSHSELGVRHLIRGDSAARSNLLCRGHDSSPGTQIDAVVPSALPQEVCLVMM